MRQRRKPEPTPLSRRRPAEAEAFGPRRKRKERRRSSLRLRTGRKPAKFASHGSGREVSGARSRAFPETGGSLLPKGTEKGPEEACFSRIPWEPERSFGSGKEPEREPTGAERPRPEPDPRKVRRCFGGGVPTADSGGRQRCRPPLAFSGLRMRRAPRAASATRPAPRAANPVQRRPACRADPARSSSCFIRFGSSRCLTLWSEQDRQRRRHSEAAQMTPPPPFGRSPPHTLRAWGGCKGQAARGLRAQAFMASPSQARGALPKWRRKAWQSETESE